jgi:hypothetical protein
MLIVSFINLHILHLQLKETRLKSKKRHSPQIL